MSSEERGIDTTVQDRVDPETMEYWERLNTIADQFGLPDQWIHCPMCGAQGWRLPPHGIIEPCPVAREMFESAGLKMDAERSTALRVGIGMEEAARAMRRLTEGDDE